jgi:hypothetical protein
MVVLTRMLLIAASVAAGLLLSSATNASPLLTLDPSSPIDGKTWTMTPSDFLHSAYYTPNPTPQDSDSVAAFLKTWFSLSSTPTAVSQVDSYSDGTGTLDYTNSAGFNVLEPIQEDVESDESVVIP